jgi:hypothetical protein
MLIVWVKRIYITIPSIGEHMYRTVLESVKEVFNVVMNIYNQHATGNSVNEEKSISNGERVIR